ncbi:sodium:solute symporter family transporter [Flagellimonas myxillae]|uniref:sodium:solute symporter family transporter n=1 Tax=Flagellimonas myxillae TaxID=2942214 RepID=UPI00201F871B|nr:sodium/solute symporter [Muricauda myxillae]MCL6268067.1 sodium/solute symporter [Muricauda myxillae]
MRYVTTVLLLVISVLNGFTQEDDSILDWSNEAYIPNKVGLNGAFTGIHNNALIIAGGTNFPEEAVWEGGEKRWYKSIYVLVDNGNGKQWIDQTVELPFPMANGVSISTAQGVYCFGGDNAGEVFNAVFQLRWNSVLQQVVVNELPSMPVPLAGMGGAVVGDNLYLVGGQSTKGGPSSQTFLSFNLSPSLGRAVHTWKELDEFPGIARIQPVVIGQSNGHQDCLYVFSGLEINPSKSPEIAMLDDVYQFDPHQEKWTQKERIPSNGTPGIQGGYLAAAPAIKKGDSHILIFGGAGGAQQHLAKRLDISRQIRELESTTDRNDSINLRLSTLKNRARELLRTTAFSTSVWAYHTITDTWTQRGNLPQTKVVTNALDWNGAIVIPGGEVSPGVRTNEIMVGAFRPYQASFGTANYITLVTYLVLMILMGWYFSRRNKTTDDYFLGGGRIPWWAAGLSIYATMLSAITYLSQPALAYAFDWQTYLGYFAILLMVPVVVAFYLPFYRKLKVTTAYEYLEKRFNIVIRMFGSVSFVLFQLVRMGIVVYLPALALSTVVGMDIYLAIVIMGILAIVYTYLGGMEAVIWTDVIQVIVLILGLVAGLIFIALEIGDVGYIFETAIADGKMKLFDFRLSFTEVVTWSLFLGSFALNFAPYTTDQAVVQRYMTTADEKEARKSIWLNGIMAIPAGILIFCMGTFLYVYFKEHPEFLSIGMQNDSIFPLFITKHLPPGVAGLVIAGIYSASMSSLDSSMHSVSTVVTVDFYKRFSKKYSEVKGLNLAKWVTVFVGTLGTAIACLMAAFPVKSLFFFFQEVVGLLGSAIAGIFILGIFIKKANWKGTLAGALLSVAVLAFVKYNTSINFYIYPLIAIPTCVIGGVLFSALFPVKQGNVDEFVYSRK